MIDEVRELVRKMEVAEPDRVKLGPVVLPAWLYDRALAHGLITKMYIRQPDLPKLEGPIWKYTDGSDSRSPTD